MNTVFYSLAKYLHPLLIKRLVSAGSYWRNRLEAHQDSLYSQPSGAFLEAWWWVNRIEDIRQHLSVAQLATMLQKIPEREVWVMWGRSQGRIFKDMAHEMGVNISLVKTLYGRGLKRCTTLVLESQRPDLSWFAYEAKPVVQKLQTSNQCQGLLTASAQRVWQVTEAVLRQRLGKGTKVVLERLQAELAPVEPDHLDVHIEHWLSLHFSRVASAQFRELLGQAEESNPQEQP